MRNPHPCPRVILGALGEAFELTLDRAQLNQLIYGGTRNVICTPIFEPSVWAIPE